MPRRILWLFLGVRVACLPIVQTWFVPDEYWQATEVAHSMAFRYGYKTWEWQEGIRGVLYPAILASLFKLLACVGADTHILLIHMPRLLHAMLFAVGDYHIWRMSKTLYGSASAWWSAVCLSTAWFLCYCAPRTLTSCVEMVLLAVAFSYYPWRREKESISANYLWFVGLACVVRPTAAVPYLPLALQHLWHSNHKGWLLLRYIMITTTLLAFTLTLDSWYYGQLVVVPWRFVRFNVVSGLSAHYGTLPWHWYVSQGLPATLTTHLIPLSLALFSQPARHKSLLPVIIWSLLVYSCLGHKEFRFLLPVLPLCLCIAGDYIAFHLTAHTKRSNRLSQLRRSVILVALVVPNACALLYLGLLHQRGALDVMQVLRREVDADPHASILFLMPCHSTPYYSHLHRNVSMRFLTCEPNLKGEKDYQDEADLFDEDPLSWMLREYGKVSALSHSEKVGKDTEKKEKELELPENGMREEEQKTKREKEEEIEKGFRNRRKFDNERSMRDTDDVIVKFNGDILNSKEEVEEGREDRVRSRTGGDINKGIDKEQDIKKNQEIGERSDTSSSPPCNLPSHIVMFSVLSGKVEQFLSLHHYHLCHQLFHAHINDGRRSTHIHVYCRPRLRG